ncbi:MAG: hypothetical protein ACK5LK_11930, partial [Chthoniobacterales bacterium]
MFYHQSYNPSRARRLLGYHRIALVLPRSIDERLGHRHLGAFRTEQMRLLPKDQLLPLILEGNDQQKTFL